MTEKLSIASELEDDHIGLNKDIAAIMQLLELEIDKTDFQRWRLRFLWNLRDFKNRLLKHFDLEEVGGFMTEVVSIKPEFSAKVGDLKDEHEKISRELDDILMMLKRLEKLEGDSMDLIKTRLQQLMTSLGKHENEEHQLLQKAYYRDYGGPA